MTDSNNPDRGSSEPNANQQTPPGVAKCTISYTFASFYLVIGLVLLVLPWCLSSIFSFASGFTVNVVGLILFVAALAHLYYVSRVVALGRKCECP
jgi:apolipoprotein N-acyltransferase